ncbi:MAG: glutamate racemase [Deltaproteobacteria bacterium]|nr:glutamate racemase [Deltaproteobacteria bacterium]
MKNNPIGIFDSGIGGLTVLRELIKALPSEDTAYLGDTARVPYGTKSAETVTSYSLEITEFLVEYGIKALVVGCNTASAFSVEKLRAVHTIPIIGVIEPGAKAAAKATRTKRVGVIGTEGTIRSNAYSNAIKEIDPNIVVYNKACPLFVPLAEEGWTNNEVAAATVREYLSDIKDEHIDTLVLGCTHYPLLKEIIGEFFGHDVTLIDSAEETALEANHILTSKDLLNENNSASHKFFVTDSAKRFQVIGTKFLGKDEEIDAELIKLGK